MKPKEALIKDGFLPANAGGRGRLSLAGIERCKELVAQGWVIEGYAAAPVSVKDTTSPAAPKVVKAAKPVNVKEVLDFTIFYERDEHKAVGVNDGKTYGMAEVCNICRVSLVQNQCLTPTILGDIPVKIVRL